jgi:site-specific DNA recombinase
MAELEASMISERVSSGRKQKASEGGYNGSRCPLGYKYNNGAFTVDPSASYWIREIFTRFAAGQGMSKIADDLNAAGAVTAKGGKWYAGTVRYILNNGIYAGLAQWDGTEKQKQGNHPSIISKELYEQAHARLQALRPGPMAV